MYISSAPLLILVFLVLLSPMQANREPYELIMIGTLLATLGPIPMFFGLNMVNFMLFIGIISFAEALYSPMINVFSFNFTKPGREGTFLTLTAAPTYFTMALTGVVGGFLLENFYPVTEDATHTKQPQYIWLVIIIFSGVSCICLYLGRNFFNVKEDPADNKDVPDLEEEEHNLIKGEKDEFDIDPRFKSNTISYANTRGSFSKKDKTNSSIKLD